MEGGAWGKDYKGTWETLGSDRDVYYIDCGDSLTDAYICQNLNCTI